MDTKNTMEVSNKEARLLEQLRANPQLEEHLRALLECAMAEHPGQAGADKVEERVVKHIKDMGLAALHGWAGQTGEQCARQLLRARACEKKKKRSDLAHLAWRGAR